MQFVGNFLKNKIIVLLSLVKYRVILVNWSRRLYGRYTARFRMIVISELHEVINWDMGKRL